MPMVRANRSPSISHCQVSRRVRITRSAIMSMAVSRSSSFQSRPYGGR